MPVKNRDRTTGLPLPDPVVPEGSICIQISVPDALEYRSALKGVLSELGKAWTWSQTSGEDNEDAFTAAELWRERIREAVYQLECPELMTCADVANCIETDTAVQTAIANQITNNSSTQQNVYNTSAIGVPMTATQRDSAVSSSDDCEPDSLFGSITAIVEQLDQNNRDFLEIIEVGTNTRERLSSLIAAIPLIETLPIDDGISMLDKLQSEILENYEAQWTTALADEYRCDLFCMVKDEPDCELTFQALVEYWNNRLGTALEPINFFGSVLQYFLLGTWSGSTVVDIMMLIQLSAWQEASNWSGVSLRTLQTVGLLGANNPDSDWELLCEDCPPPPVGEVIINPNVNWMGIPCCIGQVTDTGGGTWSVLMQPGNGAQMYTIKESEGRVFRMVGRAISGTESCQGWVNADNSTFFDGCSSTDQYAGEWIKEYFGTAASARTMTFTLELQE